MCYILIKIQRTIRLSLSNHIGYAANMLFSSVENHDFNIILLNYRCTDGLSYSGVTFIRVQI